MFFTVNPLLSPTGTYLFQPRLKGGAGCLKGGWGLFNLAKMKVSVFQENLNAKWKSSGRFFALCT